MTYSYDPTEIKTRGKDKMRFELGDTYVDGGAETCALSDEEYSGIVDGIEPGIKAWLSAKLYALEAIMFKLSYQVDTKIDVLSYGLGDRAALWQKLYEQTKAEIQAKTGFPSMDGHAMKKRPYFHTGMEENPRAHLPEYENFPFRKTE